MKKIKTLLILFLIFPTLVSASSSLEGNMTGGSIYPSFGGGGSSNPNYNCVYYFGFSGVDSKTKKPQYATNGLRVTFFDKSGRQVGNTIDVWYWLEAFYYWRGEYVSTTDYGFKIYRSKSTLFTPYVTKYEYIKGREFKIMNKGNSYTYYYDDQSRYFKDSKGKYENSPFLYYFNTNDRNQNYLKEYFTTPSVMERYMKLAEVDKSIDISLGNYVVTLEPMITLSRMSCSGKTSYVGRYTITEIAKLGGLNKIYIDNNTLSNTSKMLYLERDLTVGTFTFKAPTKVDSMKKNNVKNLLNDQGIAIASINGSEVCYPDCQVPTEDNPKPEVDKKFKIVYHPINLANPFIYSKTGEVRKLNPNSNWYDKENTIDINIYSKAPFLTVTLNPADITKIREYNNKVGFKEFGCSNFKNSFSKIFSNTNFCK